MSKTAGKPNLRCDHLYVVFRIDLPVDAEKPEDAIVVTRMFSVAEAAENEAERLNHLNAEKNWRYVVRVGRLAKD